MKQLLGIFLAVAMLLSLWVTASAASFSDVSSNADYAEAVQWAADNGYVNGYNDGCFGVDDNVTRAQLSAILYRSAGSPAASGVAQFSDVSSTAYYVNAASWAADNGLINGYQDGRFGVNDPVTRQQVAAILWRWAGSPAASAEDYADESAISSYAQTAVDWSRANDIIAARSDGRFAPTDSATRVEIVSALYNYMGRNDSSTPASPSTSGNGKVLVAYFSATNTTERVAQTIANTLNADLFELEPVNPYTSSDLNYSDTSSRVCREHDDPSLQNIELVSTTPSNWDEYDTVFIGYPIWWHAAAWPVNGFATGNDFTGKTVVPFCTSASSGLEGSDTKLKDMAGTGTWLDGIRFSGGSSQTDIENWVYGLGLSNGTGERQIKITAGGTEITAALNDSPLSQELAEALPVTLSMTRLYEREYYGTSMDWEPSSEYETQVEFSVGDLAYWPRGNSLLLLFGHNTEHPTIDSGIVVIGKILTDLSVFDGLGSSVEMTFSVQNRN